MVLPNLFEAASQPQNGPPVSADPSGQHAQLLPRLAQQTHQAKFHSALVVHVGRDRPVLRIQPRERHAATLTADGAAHLAQALTRSRRVTVIGQRGLCAQRLEERGRLLRLAGLLQTPSLPIERRQADRAVRLEPHGLIKRAHRFFIAPALVEQPPGAPLAFSGPALRLLVSPDLLTGLHRLPPSTTLP